MPPLRGEAICARFLPALRADRGQLRSGGSKGEEVHAGSLIRKREVVLETALLGNPAELARVFVHELFHFVWSRTGNRLRRSYEMLLEAEMRRRARGELGWSAEVRKNGLTEADICYRSRRWREYVCESFCDSAAWLFAGLRKHEEFTLAPCFRRGRREWFRRMLSKPEISI